MKQTPMLQQYLELKARVPDAVLLYRLGDFYELFFEDAERAAPLLGVVLTRRRHNDQVTSPMCGVPHHALASYARKLLDAGLKVAVAEQVEEPTGAGGLVRREIVRVLTPGTVTEPELLGGGERRWIAAVVRQRSEVIVAYLDAAAGELGGAVMRGSGEATELLSQLRPVEVLLSEGGQGVDGLWPPELPPPVVALRPPSWFEPERGAQILCRALGVGSLRAFALAPDEPLTGAAGALLAYLEETQGSPPRHLTGFTRRRAGDDLVLDAATVRNLELLKDMGGERQGSLAHVLDATVTAMGSRRLREWLVRPLGDAAAAAERHSAVAVLVEDAGLLTELRDGLRRIGDLERLAARLGLAQARPGELVALRSALGEMPGLRRLLTDAPAALLASLGGQVDCLPELGEELERTLAADPPALVGPGTIRSGRDAELDEARALARGGKEVLGELEARERQRTGIPTLKVRYNRLFGYAFEVSNAHLGKVPADYTRRQTLAGGERFTTPELEELERKIVSAEARAQEREGELYRELVRFCAEHAQRVATTARALAEADVLAAFAERARKWSYVRPRLVSESRIRLQGSRHPVIEQLSRASFVPNDVELDADHRQIVLLTGPNMGGKSTYLRQVALAVIMARAGSFVAAEEAEIGEIDRVFTRVGAADDIARGESTFMVEMTEVAHILRHATSRSLVILDEVGRGTATFDGLSLAWAVVEALHDPPAAGGGRPLVLFATHYHELTDLAQRLERVVNASLAVKEWQGQVIFLHRVVPGPADRSYGIHVARLAGVPAAVCRRAEQVLRQLERQELKVLDVARPLEGPRQLSLFPPPEEAVAERLRRLNLDSLTPLEALNLLAALKKEVEE